MEHQGLKVYINDDPCLTVTNLRAMSNVAIFFFFANARPRYQVSVYMTICRLVLFKCRIQGFFNYLGL